MNSIHIIGQVIWILGLAIMMANLGWRLWKIRITYPLAIHQSNRPVLETGILMVCVGVTLSTDLVWARLLFASMTAIIAIMTVLARKTTSQGQR